MNRKLKLSLMVGIPLAGIIAFLFPQGRAWILKAIAILSSFDTEPVKAYIRSFGSLAVVISFLLMIFQSIVAPLPAFLITFANAAIFGWIWGAVISWSSAMAGAAACYGIARLYGREAVSKLTGKTALKSVDDFFAKYGANAILIARLLPFMPFDIVSYAAGLTSTRFWPFFIATGLGQLPATIIYSYAGDMLGGGAKTFVFGLFIIFAAVALTVLLRSIFAERFKKKGVSE
jgi:uncharacterized membrane protein YdjX (TVP38/TMEM64 family)